MKGLILCAGRGTRLRPLTNTRPKTLLPVANRPMLIHCVEKLHALGIEDIGLVINPSQQSLVRSTLLEYGMNPKRFTFIHQARALGISHAVKRAEAFVDRESFLLLLGDNLIGDSLRGLKESLLQQDAYASLLLKEVKNPKTYGIAYLEGERIVRVEEKPNQPASRLAVIGAYAFHPTIFSAIDELTPSERGEYEITDAIQWLIDRHHPVVYSITDGHFFDVGTVDRWLEANRWMLHHMRANRRAVHSETQGTTLIPPVMIGENCRIRNAVIGPYVTVQDGTTIEDCKIEHSIVLKNAQLKRVPHPISGSVIGEQATICAERDGSCRLVLGDGGALKLKGGGLDE